MLFTHKFNYFLLNIICIPKSAQKTLNRHIGVLQKGPSLDIYKMQTGMKLHIVIQMQGETCFEIGPLIPSDILFRNIHV